MMTRFANLTLAALTALGLALTPVPAAADPDGEDIAKIIAGLAVLGIVAKAASDRDKKRKARVNNQINQFGSIDNRRVIEGDLRRPQGRAVTRSFKQVALPQRCERVLNTTRGQRLVYGARCLNRNYQYANRLPQRCERLVRTDRGVRTVYGARCLNREGWRVALR